MNIVTVVPPPFEPVTVAAVYEHMRWDIEETEGSPPTPVYPLEGSVKTAIAAARRQVEQAVKRSLVAQTLRINYSSMPADYWGFWGWHTFGGAGRGIELLKPPVLSVEEVAYYDQENQLVVVDAADYFLTDELVPQVQFVRTFQLPACSVYRRPDAARVTYRAGYTPEGSPVPDTQEAYAANVPDGLKQAIMIGVQLLLDRFDANERADLTRAQEALLSPYTVYTF